MITVDTRLVSEEDSSLEPVFCRLLQSKVLALSLLLVQIIRLSRHKWSPHLSLMEWLSRPFKHLLLFQAQRLSRLHRAVLDTALVGFLW